MALDFGRQGELGGVFVAEKAYINYLTSHEIEVSFGEALGKYSDIAAVIDENDIKLITDDTKVIEVVKEYNLESGYNPLDQAIGYATETPENGVDWNDCTVEEFIEFKLNGTIPDYYKKDHEEWLKSHGNDKQQ